MDSDGTRSSIIIADRDQQIKVLRAALKLVLRNRDLSINPHELARQADKIAKVAETERAVVLEIIGRLVLDLVEDSFVEAKRANAGGGH